MDYSDQDLIARLLRGENQALNEIMVRYKQRLFSFIYRYTGDDETALDLLQETFTKMYFSAHTFKPEYKFSTWLFQIALNLCRDQGRKKNWIQFFSMDTLMECFDFSDKVSDPAVITQSSQAIRQIHQSIESLPHKLKAALILFSLEERSQEECAELLGVSRKTVETRVYRARRLLAKKLLIFE